MFVFGTPSLDSQCGSRPDGGDDGGAQPRDIPPTDRGEFERSSWAHACSRAGRSRPRSLSQLIPQADPPRYGRREFCRWSAIGPSGLLRIARTR
jgi:hypothetical protein